MSLLDRMHRVAIVAPHPDDEVLGCGGTIARLAAMGREVHVVIATRGQMPRYQAADVERVRAEAKEAHARLGVKNTHWLDLPAAELDRVSHADANHQLATTLSEIAPDTLFLPFVGDVHLDHQLIFLSGMVAARPRNADFPMRIFAYETLSETNWNAPYLSPGFIPNVFVDISEHLAAKVEAFRLYGSQVQPFPHERSVETIEALARLRGSTVCRAAAEGFVMVREVG